LTIGLENEIREVLTTWLSTVEPEELSEELSNKTGVEYTNRIGTVSNCNLVAIIIESTSRHIESVDNVATYLHEKLYRYAAVNTIIDNFPINTLDLAVDIYIRKLKYNEL